MKISLIGAKSTGKSELAKQLAQHFQAQGKSVQSIPEDLRMWCNQNKRMPKKNEQLAIAAEQVRQIDSAPACEVLITDSTALTVAVHSEVFFNDTSLYNMALAHQRRFDATLLMGLDLPWVAHGSQRDGSHLQKPFDTALRNALSRGGIYFQVVYGAGESRLQNALRCLTAESSDSAESVTSDPINRPHKLRNWMCERCSDPVCEHRMFSDLMKSKL